MNEYNQSENQPQRETPFQQNGFQAQTDAPQKPSVSLPLAILSTIIGCCSPCCAGLILGIISIIFATQVDSKYRLGDFSGAESAAKNSRILALIAIGIAVVYAVITIIMFLTGYYDNMIEQFKIGYEEGLNR